MSSDEVERFLSAGRRTGKLATTRADGSPHVAPIWFVLDGGDVVFMTGAATVKGKNLLRDGRAAMAVDYEELPYGFVVVSGTTEISSAAAGMLELSIAIARRYVGDADAEAYGRRNAVPGELLVRLHPDNVVALDGLAD